MAIRAILFDLWGTLIHDPEYRSRPRQEWRATNVLAVMQRYGESLDFETVDRALSAAGARLGELHDEGRDVGLTGRTKLFLEQLSGGRPPSLPENAVAEIGAAIIDMRPDLAPRLADDAVTTVRDVKLAGLKTALVCNAGFTASPTMRPMLAGWGLAPYLDVLVFSDDLLLAKPHPAVFQRALDELDLQSAEAAFVGDSPHNDIRGAQDVGLFAVQIGNRDQDGVRPDARIASLTELLPTLSACGLLSRT